MPTSACTAFAPLLRGWAKFGLTCSVGLLANVGVAAVLVRFGFHEYPAAIIGIVVGSVWNFALSFAVRLGQILRRSAARSALPAGPAMPWPVWVLPAQLTQPARAIFEFLMQRERLQPQIIAHPVDRLPQIAQFLDRPGPFGEAARSGLWPNRPQEPAADRCKALTSAARYSASSSARRVSRRSRRSAFAMQRLLQESALPTASCPATSSGRKLLRPSCSLRRRDDRIEPHEHPRRRSQRTARQPAPLAALRP